MTSSRFALVALYAFGWSCVVHAEAGSPAPVAARPLTALSDGEFALVRSVGDRRFWVSKQRPHGNVKPKSITELEPDVAFGCVGPRVLPAALKPLVGAKVIVRPASTSGASCEVELKDWGVFAEFDASDETEGADDDSEAETPKLSAQRLLVQFGQDSQAQLRYAVEITEATRSCASAVWARAAALPPVPVFAVTELERPALDKERVRLRKTAPFREAQARYAKEGKGFWDKHPDTSVSGWTASVGPAQFTIVSLQHIDDCQSFNEDASFVFRDQRPLATELLTAFFPKLALDLNGDGQPEWLTEDQLIGWNGHALEKLLSVEIESYGCRC